MSFLYQQEKESFSFHGSLFQDFMVLHSAQLMNRLGIIPMSGKPLKDTLCIITRFPPSAIFTVCQVLLWNKPIESL